LPRIFQGKSAAAGASQYGDNLCPTEVPCARAGPCLPPGRRRDGGVRAGRPALPKKQQPARIGGRSPPAARRPQRGPRAPADYMRSIIALPKPEQETCVAPGMSRAKS
jgi:hypothetical protein